MKLSYILLFALTAAIITTSCTQNGGSGNDHYKRVYKKSISYGDYLTATDAMYDLWVNDTMNAPAYKDTLANLYFLRGQYLQSAVLCKDVLSKHPGDLKLEELLAAADQNINNLNEALSLYQTIYQTTHDLFHLYQIAVIQFNMSRVGECNQTLNLIISDTGSVHQRVQITSGQNQVQYVPYKAAALNIHGVIAKGLNQNDVAKKSFQDALAIYPDFILAKNNLSGMGKPSTGTAATTTK